MRYKFRILHTLLTTLGLLSTSTAYTQEYAVVSGGQILNCSITTPAGPKPLPQSVEAIFRVDLVTGARSIISTKTCEEALNNEDRGWGGITGFAIESPGYIVVAGKTLVYRIDAATGAGKLLTDFLDPTQGSIFQPISLADGIIDIAIGATGHIFASMVSTLNFAKDKLFSIDPGTGNRTVLSDGSVSAQGGPNAFIRSLAVAPSSGLIYVTGATPGTPYPAFLFTVDPVTGLRTGISSRNDPAQGYWGTGAFGHDVSGIAVNDDGGDGLGINPIAVDTSGRIYAIVPAGTDSHAMLVTVDGSSGIRTLVSDFGNSTQGRIIDNPIALKISSTGQLLVLDDGRPNTVGALLTVDPLSGTRAVVSDFSDLSQGPTPGLAGGSVTALAVGTIPASPVLTGTGPVLTFLASSSSTQVGQTIDYTVSVFNDGPTDARKVKLSDTLPTKAKWVSTGVNGGVCRGRATVTCNFGTVSPGATVSATITALAKKPGAVKNKVVLTYKTPKKPGSTKLKVRTQRAKVQTIVTR